MFCYPEHIDAEMQRVFGDLRTNTFLRGRTPRAFADGAAHLLAELNASTVSAKATDGRN